MRNIFYILLRGQRSPTLNEKIRNKSENLKKNASKRSDDISNKHLIIFYNSAHFKLDIFETLTRRTESQRKCFPFIQLPAGQKNEEHGLTYNDSFHSKNLSHFP